MIDITRALNLAIASLVAFVGSVEAGPYCGFDEKLAPADESTLPVAPTVSMFAEDHYYAGKRQRKAKPPALKATLDGKAVAFTTRDLRTIDGVIRFLKFKTKQTGKLEIWRREKPKDDEQVFPLATYTIVDDWTAPAASATVARVSDRRLGPYRYLGHAAAIRTEVPAIAFKLLWRRESTGPWRSLALPVNVNEDRDYDPKAAPGDSWKKSKDYGRSEAWLGERMCGMIENVPLAVVEQGVHVKLTAQLPDGKDLEITVTNPVVIPAPTEAEKKRDRLDR